MLWVNGKAAEKMESGAVAYDEGFYSMHIWSQKHAGVNNPSVDNADEVKDWDKNHNGAPNTIRLGEASDHGVGPFPRNYSADMTVDEFYMWRLKEHPGAAGQPTSFASNGYPTLGNDAAKSWREGRYYRPKDDAVFTSAPIFIASSGRKLTPASGGTISSAEMNAPAAAASRGTTTGATGRKTKVLGIAWTWYAEEYSRKDGAPLVIDYRGPDTWAGGTGSPVDSAAVTGYVAYREDLKRPAPQILKQEPSMCSVVLRVVSPEGMVKQELAGPEGLGFSDAGFSFTADPVTGGSAVEMDEKDALQYEVNFKIVGLQEGQYKSTLLGSPAFDDITIYYGSGEVECLSWRLVNTSF